MFPNTRRVRSRYIWNVIDKVLLDNPVSQWTLRVIARSGLIEMGTNSYGSRQYLLFLGLSLNSYE